MSIMAWQGVPKIDGTLVQDHKIRRRFKTRFPLRESLSF